MLRVLAEASCLVDARREAGIGRYATLLLDALREVDGVSVEAVVPARPPRSESRPARWAHAQRPVVARAWRERPALVHGLGGEPVLGWPASRQVVTLHDVELWHAVADAGGARAAGLGLYARLIEGGLRRCGGLVAISSVVADEAVEVLGLPPSRVFVVPHGVPPGFSAVASSADEELRVACGVSAADGPYLMWTGSLRSRDPRKALEVLVEAVAGLGPRAVRLVMVGAPGAETRRVAALARRSHVHVVLPGHVPDASLAALLRGAAGVVVPSLYEGFGLPALEAMASGAPLVATRAGNLPALVGDAGVLVEAGSADALLGGVASVLGDAALAARLRAAGPVRAAEFTWRRTAEMTADAYRAVAQQ
ncbi:MAG TPA: glycosyltransferase family 1 protein [Candidatus Angelobacter sp.]|nr:glycosyltransferase family 1 protein [Candidatus Angelobacter sp.]